MSCEPLQNVTRQGTIARIRAAVAPAAWPWWLLIALVAVLLDFYVVLVFIRAQPPLPPLPELPPRGVVIPPGIAPFPFLKYAVIGAVLVAVYLAIVFTRSRWIGKAVHFALVVVWLVFSFSWIYYNEGNETPINSNAYPAFGHALSKNEALYFTVGTLTTAGTGSLHPGIRDIRTIVIIQMTLGVLVLVIGVAGVVRR